MERYSEGVLIHLLSRCWWGQIRSGPTRTRRASSLIVNERKLGRDQSGMVTAELAVALVGLVVVLAMILFAVAVAVAHIRTQEAARVGARAAARGEAGGDVTAAAHRAAPGSSVEVQRSGERVRVVVRDRLRLPMLRIGGVTVTSDSVAGVEPR